MYIKTFIKIVLVSLIAFSAAAQPSNQFEGITPAERQANIEIKKARILRIDEWLLGVQKKTKRSSAMLVSLNRAEKLVHRFHDNEITDILYQLKLFLNKREAAEFEAFKLTVANIVFEVSKLDKGIQARFDASRIEKIHAIAGNTREGSISIIQTLKPMLEREIQYARAAKEYIERGGSMYDFESRWTVYAESRPLTRQNSEKILELSNGYINVYNWRPYIIEGKDPLKKLTDEEFKGLSREEKIKFLKERGLL